MASGSSWRSERELSAGLATSLIEEQFPNLAPVQAHYLDEGWDNQAFEVGGRWLFRFPKRADVEAALAVERALLPLLAPLLPVAVPAFSHVGVPTARFPFHFVGYPRLAGSSALHVNPAAVRLDAVAAELGALLGRLHAFPIDQARRLGVPDDRPRSLVELRDEARAQLQTARRHVHDSLVQRAADLLADDAAATAASPLPARLVHNDLAAEHVLLAEARDHITGIVDWGDLAVGDPTADFAGLFHWLGEPLVRATIAHYDGPVDDRLLDRARFRAVCRALLDLGYGIDTGRSEYVEAGRRALAHALGR